MVTTPKLKKGLSPCYILPLNAVETMIRLNRSQPYLLPLSPRICPDVHIYSHPFLIILWLPAITSQKVYFGDIVIETNPVAKVGIT